MHSEPAETPPVPRQVEAAGADVSEATPPPTTEAPRLSVAAAARRLGVAPATLRTWDRRYGIGPTGHTPGRHRRYSPDDTARLELMQHALVRGASPADAARFALAVRLPDADDRPRSVTAPAADPVADTAVADTAVADSGENGHPLLAHTDGTGEVGSRVRVGGHVLRLPGAGRQARGLGRAALALDSAAARALLVESIDARGVDVAWNEVVRPVLAAVAERWAYTGAGIEIEHLLSDCVVGVFGAHAAAGRTDTDVRPVLLAGMPGEQHTLPMVVLSAALADKRVPWRSLGSDLPREALVAAIRRTAPVAVVLWSQMTPTADAALLRTLPRTRPLFRTFAAGPGWNGVELPPRVVRLGSLTDAAGAIRAAVAPNVARRDTP